MSRKNKNKQIITVAANKSQKIDKPAPVKMLKEIPGLYTCLISGSVSNATAEFEWNGPKIPKEVWHEILAFFRWTYEESSSESQVRLFVNTQSQTWRGWAFPQKANTGMSAQEQDTEETKIQRAQFKPSEGWRYFGTVHHHCSASAFQSSTDESNEKSQDGIHITVGSMNKSQYDLHHRFYLGGNLIQIGLDELWEMETDLETVPPALKPLITDETIKYLIRSEMGVPPPKDYPFPEVWRTNVIVPPKVEVVTASNHGYYGGNNWNQFQTYVKRATPNLEFDMKKSMKEIKDYCESVKMTEAAAIQFISEMASLTEDELNIIGILVRNDILPDNFLNELDTMELEEQAKAEEKKSEPKVVAASPPGPGTPGYIEGDEYWWPFHH